jgi:hypothetical protein
MSWTGSGRSGDGTTTGIGDTGTHPEVDAAVRLLYRRRGWGWTGGGSLLALVVFAVIGSHLWANAGGALGVFSGLVVLVLLALTAVGLVMAVVDTVRLHRGHGAVRDQARTRTSHHSLIAHAYRYPPRHHVSAWFGRVLLLGCLVLAIGYLPNQVNGVAYLAGAAPTATFFPTSYGQDCGRGGCSTITDGTLVQGGRGIPASWPGTVSLGLPMTVRAPVWDGWGTAVSLTGDTANAIVAIIVGLFLDAVGVLAGLALIKMTQHWLKRRRQPAWPAATGLPPTPGVRPSPAARTPAASRAGSAPIRPQVSAGRRPSPAAGPGRIRRSC